MDSSSLKNLHPDLRIELLQFAPEAVMYIENPTCDEQLLVLPAVINNSDFHMKKETLEYLIKNKKIDILKTCNKKYWTKEHLKIFGRHNLSLLIPIKMSDKLYEECLEYCPEIINGQHIDYKKSRLRQYAKKVKRFPPGKPAYSEYMMGYIAMEIPKLFETQKNLLTNECIINYIRLSSPYYLTYYDLEVMCVGADLFTCLMCRIHREIGFDEFHKKYPPTTKNKKIMWYLYHTSSYSSETKDLPLEYIFESS